MNKDEQKNEIKDSIITLLNSIADIAKNTEVKSPNAKKVVETFTTTSNGLLKNLCDMINTNFDEVFKDFINQNLDKVTKEELSKPREIKEVKKGVDTGDGTTLFEPLRSEEEARKERELSKHENKESIYNNIKDAVKDIKEDKNIREKKVAEKVCTVNDKCKDCEFADICFITNNKKPSDPVDKEQKQEKSEVNEKIAETFKKINTPYNNLQSAKKHVKHEPVEFLVPKYKKLQLMNDLREEYSDIEKINKQKEEEERLKNVPEIYANKVKEILKDKKTHAYRFINGDTKVNPAVEIKIEDEFKVGKNLSIMTKVCNYIKELADFPLVTASQSEENNKSYITFYLVLY
jgi:hypothetical protein